MLAEDRLLQAFGGAIRSGMQGLDPGLTNSAGRAGLPEGGLEVVEGIEADQLSRLRND
jgi:hypothetical protein